ncbi:DNA polymerase III subunit alpha, partial [bacterium]
DRLNYELDVIGKCGFDDYMLLVREFARATRERNIYFGVRGSAAGSLVAFLTGITDVDPVDYGLTFERFLNPERVSMPDIDMDFEDQRRGEIIDWVSERYGSDKVAQIITFGTMGAKAAIKDVGRVLGYDPKVTDAMTKKIPTKPGTTLEGAYDENPEFREIIESTSDNRKLYETALHMEGRARNPGVHAAGVVISKEPLVDFVPLYRGTEGQPVTSYEMKVLEKMGMLKMDFLGLSNLTVLAKAIENVRVTEGVELDVKCFDESERATWEMLAKGDTTGVFQLESDGMTRYVTQLKPDNVRELAAMIALYRPGPMGEIPRYIDLKFGRKQTTYEDPRMEDVLKETYGVIVYQDQVLKLVQVLAGFTLGRADLLRRAMGKKDAKALAELGDEFYAGTAEKGIDRDCAERIWELLLPFAGYAFNKAHSVCYAILSFQTAWLKANYPVEY